MTLTSLIRSSALALILTACARNAVPNIGAMGESESGVEPTAAAAIVQTAERLWRALEARDISAISDIVDDRRTRAYFASLIADSTFISERGRPLHMISVHRATTSGVFFAQFEVPLRDCVDRDGATHRALLGFSFEKRDSWKVTGVYSPRSECH